MFISTCSCSKNSLAFQQLSLLAKAGVYLGGFTIFLLGWLMRMMVSIDLAQLIVSFLWACNYHWLGPRGRLLTYVLPLGPVVQSIVSLTSSLRVISLTVLADSIYNILIFFAEKMWVAFAVLLHCKSYSHFFSKKFQNICISFDVNFNESLTNDVVSFEQLSPGCRSSMDSSTAWNSSADMLSSPTDFPSLVPQLAPTSSWRTGQKHPPELVVHSFTVGSPRSASWQFVCVLRFYDQVNPVRSCRARSVYLTTLLLGRLSPASR